MRLTTSASSKDWIGSTSFIRGYGVMAATKTIFNGASMLARAESFWRNIFSIFSEALSASTLISQKITRGVGNHSVAGDQENSWFARSIAEAIRANAQAVIALRLVALHANARELSASEARNMRLSCDFNDIDQFRSSKLSADRSFWKTAA